MNGKKMTKIMLLTLLAIVLAFGSVGCSSKRSEEASGDTSGEKIIIKFSHVVAENTPKGQAAIMFAEKVKEKTNGRVEVQVYPNSQLYKDEDVLNAIQQGNVQMAAPATSVITKLYPQWQVFDLPFAFANEEQVQQAMDGEIGEKLFTMLTDQNLLGLTMWDNGFKHMSSNKNELIKPEDFAGQKFRVMSSKMLEEQFNAVGANPTPMAFGEVYSALEQGVIDGQENTLSNIYSKKFHEVQKYMTLSGHGYLGYAVITNADFWNGLPDDVRAQVKEALDETTQWVRENGKKLNKEELEKIKADNPNLKIHELTAEEKQVWMDKMDVTYDMFKDEIGEDLINAVLEMRKQ